MPKKNQNKENFDFHKKSFEENLAELESIVTSLETENTSLEEALKLYQKGINISIYLNKTLDNIQSKIEIFKQKTQNGEIITDPFFFEFNNNEYSIQKNTKSNNREINNKETKIKETNNKEIKSNKKKNEDKYISEEPEQNQDSLF